MNGHAEPEFRFTGQLVSTFESPEGDSDRSLLEQLQEQRRRIALEIRALLQDEVADELGADVTVVVEIDFREGSVLFTGAITILGYLATAAGAIDFVEKISRLIRRVLRVILRRRTPPSRRVLVRVFPMFPVAMTPVAATKNRDEASLFNLRTILLAVTLLNTAIFIGGSVYTGISVTSIQEKYEKAQSEIEKVRQDYEKYRAGLQDRLGDIEGQLRTTSKETDDVRLHAKQLSEDLASLDGQVHALQTSITSLRAKGGSWISLSLAYHQANWVLKAYLYIVPFCILAISILALGARWRW